jgi:hypothetical protein
MKKYILFALIVGLSFTYSCNRGSQSTSAATEKTSETNDQRLMTTDDFGEEAIAHLKSKQKITPEQEEQIKSIWAGYDFNKEASLEERREILKKFRQEIKKTVLKSN